jgi:hypothetical protein
VCMHARKSTKGQWYVRPKLFFFLGAHTPRGLHQRTQRVTKIKTKRPCNKSQTKGDHQATKGRQAKGLQLISTHSRKEKFVKKVKRRSNGRKKGRVLQSSFHQNMRHIYAAILLEDRSGWSWMQHYYSSVSA